MTDNSTKKILYPNQFIDYLRRKDPASVSTAKCVRVYFAGETTVTLQSKNEHTFVALHPSMIEFIRETGIVYGPRTYLDMNRLYDDFDADGGVVLACMMYKRLSLSQLGAVYRVDIETDASSGMQQSCGALHMHKIWIQSCDNNYIGNKLYESIQEEGKTLVPSLFTPFTLARYTAKELRGIHRRASARNLVLERIRAAPVPRYNSKTDKRLLFIRDFIEWLQQKAPAEMADAKDVRVFFAKSTAIDVQIKGRTYTTIKPACIEFIKNDGKHVRFTHVKEWNEEFGKEGVVRAFMKYQKYNTDTGTSVMYMTMHTKPSHPTKGTNFVFYQYLLDDCLRSDTTVISPRQYDMILEQAAVNAPYTIKRNTVASDSANDSDSTDEEEHRAEIDEFYKNNEFEDFVV